MRSSTARRLFSSVLSLCATVLKRWSSNLNSASSAVLALLRLSASVAPGIRAERAITPGVLVDGDGVLACGGAAAVVGVIFGRNGRVLRSGSSVLVVLVLNSIRYFRVLRFWNSTHVF